MGRSIPPGLTAQSHCGEAFYQGEWPGMDRSLSLVVDLFFAMDRRAPLSYPFFRSTFYPATSRANQTSVCVSGE